MQLSLMIVPVKVTHMSFPMHVERVTSLLTNSPLETLNDAMYYLLPFYCSIHLVVR